MVNTNILHRSPTSDRVKLVVSSRRINTCVLAIENSPGYGLQDLTRPDMKRFITENLELHESMVQMARLYSQSTQELTVELVSKAQGVCLWVKLVVQILVNGLEDGANFYTWQKRHKGFSDRITMDPFSNSCFLPQNKAVWYTLTAEVQVKI